MHKIFLQGDRLISNWKQICVAYRNCKLTNKVNINNSRIGAIAEIVFGSLSETFEVSSHFCGMVKLAFLYVCLDLIQSVKRFQFFVIPSTDDESLDFLNTAQQFGNKLNIFIWIAIVFIKLQDGFYHFLVVLNLLPIAGQVDDGGLYLPFIIQPLDISVQYKFLQMLKLAAFQLVLWNSIKDLMFLITVVKFIHFLFSQHNLIQLLLSQFTTLHFLFELRLQFILLMLDATIQLKMFALLFRIVIDIHCFHHIHFLFQLQQSRSSKQRVIFLTELLHANFKTRKLLERFFLLRLGFQFLLFDFQLFFKCLNLKILLEYNLIEFSVLFPKSVVFSHSAIHDLLHSALQLSTDVLIDLQKNTLVQLLFMLQKFITTVLFQHSHLLFTKQGERYIDRFIIAALSDDCGRDCRPIFFILALLSFKVAFREEADTIKLVFLLVKHDVFKLLAELLFFLMF